MILAPFPVGKVQLKKIEISCWTPSEILHLFVGSFSLVCGFNPSEKYARQIGSFPEGSG